MNARNRCDRIREEHIGSQDKRILLVEGADDKEAFRILLGRFLSGWEGKWAIVEANGKKPLQEILAEESQWIGIVDRDEWDEEAAEEHRKKLPNLWVLPRFCLENYLIDPDELWDALPEALQKGVRGGRAAFSDEIVRESPKYVRHGALWTVVSPLWSGLRARGFKEALASEESIENAQNDDEIRRILDEWDALLNPARIFAEFHAELKESTSLPLKEQFSRRIHGKIFWKNVIFPVLTSLFGQAEGKKRRKDIFDGIPRPADLEPFFERLRQG